MSSIGQTSFIRIVSYRLYQHLPAATVTHRLLSTLTSMTLSLLPINKIQAPGLNLTVNKGADKAGNDFLGLGVVVNFA